MRKKPTMAGLQRENDALRESVEQAQKEAAREKELRVITEADRDDLKASHVVIKLVEPTGPNPDETRVANLVSGFMQLLNAQGRKTPRGSIDLTPTATGARRAIKMIEAGLPEEEEEGGGGWG